MPLTAPLNQSSVVVIIFITWMQTVMAGTCQPQTKPWRQKQMQAKTKRGSLPYSTNNRKAWADAREMYEKSRGCQKFSKHLREAEIYRSFRAEAGSFIVHGKFWVGQSYQSSSENTRSLCTAVWSLSFVLLGLLLLTSLQPFQTLLSHWALSWVWKLLPYGILCSCRTWEEEVRDKTHPNPDWLQERLAPTPADCN